jgi:hypothetical protein
MHEKNMVRYPTVAIGVNLSGYGVSSNCGQNTQFDGKLADCG